MVVCGNLFGMEQKIVATCDLKEAFDDIDVAIMAGSSPRKHGMVLSDLLATNALIYKEHDEALEKYAKKSVKFLVVGNPVNTNCLIMSKYAPSIPKVNFTALTHLDHNRALYQVAAKSGVNVAHVKNVIIWGNHSNTQFPDLSHATVCKDGKQHSAKDLINDEEWVKTHFTPCIQKRGAAIFDARMLSSAASAAKAIVDQMHDWWFGTKERRVGLNGCKQ
ncbi:unnamed protein product [Mesocestoides corti]|uniref:Malate dehydrogenase, cytoplasmic n=1 Tax=Mesocestoides corti TaxID=53468 RepID=A0A0R3UQC2_MESCO|nr:unnamed protein product [Mesocestoides corti]